MSKTQELGGYAENMRYSTVLLPTTWYSEFVPSDETYTCCQRCKRAYSEPSLDLLCGECGVPELPPNVYVDDKGEVTIKMPPNREGMQDLIRRYGDQESLEKAAQDWARRISQEGEDKAFQYLDMLLASGGDSDYFHLLLEYVDAGRYPWLVALIWQFIRKADERDAANKTRIAKLSPGAK